MAQARADDDDCVPVSIQGGNATRTLRLTTAGSVPLAVYILLVKLPFVNRVPVTKIHSPYFGHADTTNFGGGSLRSFFTFQQLSI